jgi:hypothetical protein
MNYEVEMDSDGIKFITTFIKNSSGVRKLLGGIYIYIIYIYTCIHTHTQTARLYHKPALIS